MSNIQDTYFCCTLFLLVLFLNMSGFCFFFLTQMLDILYENYSDSGCYIPPERIQPILEGKREANQLNLI